jgi:Cu2+-exporting ATPase/Cu+-exporting ATPase
MKKEIEQCFHCREQIPINIDLSVGEKSFCCQGCLSVYTILSQNNLTDFYNHLDQDNANRPSSEKERYSFLDHQDFKAEYYKRNEDSYEFTFYIEGIHCTACLWLLERLSQLDIGVKQSKLNMSNSTLNITFRDDAKLSDIAGKIYALGYTPHPILGDDQESKIEIQENKRSLLRIGIAFACMGNIMLYTFAIYLGAGKEFAQYFNWFSFILSIPVVFYCSIPLYRGAYYTLKAKSLSIDLPIVIVIGLSFTLGLASLFTTLEIYYFDTISMLVFLLLSSRYLLMLTQKKALSLNNISNILQRQ